MRKNENNIIFNVRNTTLNLKNITIYFTGKEKIITLVSIIIMLSFINIILCSSNIFYNSNVSALTYQTSTNIGFTFLPALNVSLSNDNLIINNLVPGGGAVDSNTITINVSTNIAEGYNLYATVGNSANETTSLTNISNSNYTFDSLSSNMPNLSSFANNNWGYSYSLDSGTTWISGDYDNASTGYNGLPLYTNTGIKLVEEADNTSSTVDFKIAARAGNTQPSGEYTNVINFTVVSNTIPTTMLDAFIASGAEMYNGYFKMQDMTSEICKSVDVEESELQLVDLRDGKLYWVAKLKDGNCWMTQNLDLDLSHEVALTSETSDIDPESYGKTIYTAETGYSKDEATGIVSWLPSTIDSGGVQRADTIIMNGNTVPNWTDSNINPYSADPGERYRYTNSTSYNEATYTSLKNCTNANNNDISGCQHTHFGNYYNWPAAVASNNTTGASGSQANSICPKNWNLPASGEYNTMLSAQGIITNYNPNGFRKIRTIPLYFSLFGRIGGGSLVFLGSYGYYWLNMGDGTNSARGLVFNSTNITPTGSGLGKFQGYSVRCTANTN